MNDRFEINYKKINVKSDDKYLQLTHSSNDLKFIISRKLLYKMVGFIINKLKAR